jgi:hypothetical protein
VNIYHLTMTELGDECSPRWDVNYAFVIVAQTARRARWLASQQSGDENRDNPRFWLDADLTSCRRIGEVTQRPPWPSRRERVVSESFRAG